MGETIRIKDLPEKEFLSSDDLFVNSDTITTAKVTSRQIADYVAQSDEIDSVVVKKEDVGQPMGIAPLDASGKIDGTYITYGTDDFTAFPGSEGEKLKETKVDKIEGKGLSSNDFTDEEKSKLNGVEEEANKYTHPDTHPADMIQPDAEHRFVTDAEKAKWNNALNNANNYSDINYQQATGYTDEKIAALINGAPTTLDTLKEIADAMEENQNVVKALEEAIGNKANESEFDSHVKDKSNPHGVTKAQLGLENLANERQYSASNPQPSVAGSSGSCTGNAATATKWQTTRNINGMSIDGSANVANYGTCSVATATAEKTVACTGFILAAGAEITVKFTATNTASGATLNVNNTGAKQIYYGGLPIESDVIRSGHIYTFRYDGVHYELVGEAGVEYPIFDTADSTSPTGWTDMPLFSGNLKLSTLCQKISTMFKNVRWLYSMVQQMQISELTEPVASSHALTKAEYTGTNGYSYDAVIHTIKKSGLYYISSTAMGYTYENTGRFGTTGRIIRNGQTKSINWYGNFPVYSVRQYISEQISTVVELKAGDSLRLGCYNTIPYNTSFPDALKLAYSIVQIR